jgi:hypothetical protein
MYARIVNMKLKTDAGSQFTRTFESDVIPVLRKQKGLEEYQRALYPGVLKSLSKVIEGTPEVRTFEVSNSTFHKIAAGLAS